MSKKFANLAVLSLCVLALALSGCSSLPFKGLGLSSKGESGVPSALKTAHEAGIEMMKQKDYRKAARHFSKLAAAYPKFAGPQVNLALALLHLKQYDKAQDAIDAAVKLRPDHYRALTIRGQILRHQGEFEAAEKDYRRAISLNDSYPNAVLNLGILYDLYLHEPKKALANYQSYLKMVKAEDTPVKSWVVDLERRLK